MSSWRQEELAAWRARPAEDRHDTVLLHVDDLISALLYYDRKEDSGDFPMGAVESAIADGAVTAEEIIVRFGQGIVHHTENFDPRDL